HSKTDSHARWFAACCGLLCAEPHGVPEIPSFDGPGCIGCNRWDHQSRETNGETMKQGFVAIHDYGQGSVGIRVFARSRFEVSDLLPYPEWVVYDPDEAAAMLRGLDNLPESDIDSQSP